MGRWRVCHRTREATVAAEDGAELEDMTPVRGGAPVDHGGPVPAGGMAAVGAHDGYLLPAGARGRGRRCVQRWDFGAPVTAPPCAVDGRLVAMSARGLVACFRR